MHKCIYFTAFPAISVTVELTLTYTSMGVCQLNSKKLNSGPGWTTVQLSRRDLTIYHLLVYMIYIVAVTNYMNLKHTDVDFFPSYFSQLGMSLVNLEIYCNEKRITVHLN